MQLELPKQTVKLANVNPRAERHGDEIVMAADLKIDANVHRDILDCFDGQMRKLLFRNPAVGEQQNLAIGNDDGLTAIKNPWLDELKCDLEFTGYTATIHEGMELSNPLIIPVDAKDFRISPIEGGSVRLVFRLTCHPSEEEIGRLCALMQTDIELTLEAPKAEKVQKKLAAVS